MSSLRLDAILKRLLVLCSAYLLWGVCPASASSTLSDGIQRADLRVTSSEFTQQVQSLGLSGEELILAKGAWGSLTFDLTHVESAYDIWLRWRWAGPPIYKMDDPMLASLMRNWWSSMEQNLATLRFSAVDRYFAQLETLRPNDRRKIQSWRRRHYRKILRISRSGITLEGVNTDLVALLEDLEQDYPDLQLAKIDMPDAAQDSLESYELRMHELIMQYAQAAIAHRKLNREGYDQTQDDGLRDRIEAHSRKTIAPEIVAIDIRRLNRSTIDRLARTLPRDSANVFRKHALESVSPFAYTQPYYERLAGYAIESSLIESDVKDALQGLINEQKIRRLRLVEKVEGRYEARYTPKEVLNAERVFFEINAGIRGYDEDYTLAEQDLKAAKQELRNYDIERLANVQKLLGLSYVVVQDAMEGENRVSENASAATEAAQLEAARELSSPRHDSPFITRSELDALLESIDVVDAEQKQAIYSQYEEFVEKLRIARRAHERERAKLIPIFEVANIEDPVERSRRSGPVVLQHIEHAQKWFDTRRVIERVFTDQLAGKLTEDQTDDWYREVRQLRRYRMMPVVKGISRSNKDLFDLFVFLDELGIEYRTKAVVNAILENYEIEMDELLSKFEERHETAQQKMLQFNMLANQSKDPVDKRRARKHLEILENLRYRPAEKHLQYVQLISETLTGVDRTTFRTAVRHQLYPWADVISPVEIVSQIFERDHVLSEDRQSAIKDICSRYQIPRDAIIEDLISLYRA